MRRLLATIAFFSATLFAAGYNGTWKGSVETPHGKLQNVLTIKTEGEKLVGTLKNEMGEFQLQNTDNRLRNLLLDCENIAHLTVIALGPKMISVARTD